MLARRVQRGFLELPAYTRVVWSDEGREHSLESIRWNIGVLVRWMLTGTGPDHETLARMERIVRLRAVAGRPVEEGILVRRRGSRLFWDALLDLSTAAEREALIQRWDVVWAYLDGLFDITVRVFGRVYAAEHGGSAAPGNRASVLFERLSARLPLTVEDRDRAARVGFDLCAPSGPFVAQLPGAALAAHASLAHQLRSSGGLAFTEGLRVVGLASAEFDWAPFLADPRLLLAVDPPAGRDEIAAATDLLRAVVAIAARSGCRGLVRAEECLPQLLLASSPGRAGRIADRVFGKLQDGDAATLKNLVASGFDGSVAAAALGVHRNTLLYRIDRIENTIGLSLQNARDRAQVWLAVTWTDGR